MTTISVPLPADLLRALEGLVREGRVESKAHVMREALKMYLEEQAVQDVLRAEKEPRLSGDLETLAAALR